MCGLEVHVADSEVTLIRPNRDDVWSKGFICPKGTTLGRLHEDPDRLRQPMIREGDRWREASWDDAFERCDGLLHGVLEKYGHEAITAYTGNMIGHNFSLARYIVGFSALAQLSTQYSSSTMDQQPKNLSSMMMYGDPWKVPVPDIQRTDFFLVMGANPHASQGSILACPDILGEIDAIRARGGKTVVIDPIRTGTAKRADEWIPIVPGTDAALLFSIVRTLFADDLVDLGELDDFVNGVDELASLAEPYAAEIVSRVCGIPEERIRRLAHEIAAAPAAALYGRIGTCTQEFGTLTSWLIDCIAILTGNFDRPGGLMFSKPLAPFLDLLPPPAVPFGRFRSRVRGIPEVLGQLPAACLAEEIDTPGEGQIKALITIASNPAVSAAGSGRLAAALPLLECMISVDNYLNQTTRHAHVILPGASALEQPYYDVYAWPWALRSAGKYADPLFPSPAGQVEEWEILLRLGAMCGGRHNAELDVAELDDSFFSIVCQMAGVDASTVMAAAPQRGPERICDLSLRLGPWGDRYGENPGGLTLESLRAAPNGVDMGWTEPRVREIVRTPSQRIELAPPYITADTVRLQGTFERDRDRLLLVGRRHVRSLNSWMHNVQVLMKGKNRCTLLVNPSDATEIGVADGEVAVITSASGSVSAPVEVTEDIARGVVSLPHGWGHDVEGVRLDVATQYPGVNSNVLSPGDLVDEISNTAVVNGIPVTVSRSG
jgi:anaerobic selenocysteine-containing dehydrogenase